MIVIKAIRMCSLSRLEDHKRKKRQLMKCLRNLKKRRLMTGKVLLKIYRLVCFRLSRQTKF